MTETAARRALVALALLGVGIAGYLAVTRAAGAAPVCATGGCGTVQSSEYAEVLGVPVAVLGVVAYLVLAGTALVRTPAAAALGAAVALAGAAFSVYLVYLQLAVIEAVCHWCMASDALMLVLAGLTLVRLRATLAAAGA